MASPPVRLIVGLAAAVVVAGLAGLVGVGTWFARHTTTSTTLSSAEREVVLTAEAIAAWHGELELSPEGVEAVETTRFSGLGGTLEIEYEYEADGLYLLNWVNKELTRRDARQLYTMFELGLAVGLRGEDAPERVDWSARCRFGDESVAQLLVSDDEPVGHVVRVLDGRWVYAFIVVGVHADGPATLAELVQPRLAAMKRLSLTDSEPVER